MSNVIVKVLPLLTVACVLGACASNPPAAPVAAAAAPVAAVAAAPAGAPLTQEQSTLIDLQRFARSNGYKPQMNNGKPYWCKSEPPLGSHLTGKPQCVPEEGLADLQRHTIEVQNELARQQSACVGSNCSRIH